VTSAGEERQQVNAYRRVVDTQMDALGVSLDAALEIVPEALRAAVRADIEREGREVQFSRPMATIRRTGPNEWFNTWNPADGYLWPRLRTYLIDRKGWSPRDVESLDSSSDNVLKYLEDPRTDSEFSQEDFRVQGLVLGYVQSGKTANFTALIAKAADRGYRLIIVLSGIHNSLRSQTQRRLDLELGLIDDQTGVGYPDQGHAWWRITNSELNGDFKPGTDAGPLQQGSRGVMVVKKNATILRRLVRWLDHRLPDDLPVLIIDDEADQASINTNVSLEDVDLDPGADTGDVPAEDELDPSTINGLIRQLRSSFRRVSYVAYTATPFANVLIDPDVGSETWGVTCSPRTSSSVSRDLTTTSAQNGSLDGRLCSERTSPSMAWTSSDWLTRRNCQPLYPGLVPDATSRSPSPRVLNSRSSTGSWRRLPKSTDSATESAACSYTRPCASLSRTRSLRRSPT
jgi:hypothetical protein